VYAASKAAAERHARALQDDGVPVVTTYPAMVIGPGAGPRYASDAGAFFASTLRSGTMVVVDGSWSIVDVRDVAAVHAAAMVPGRGPRRYTAGGCLVHMTQAAEMIERATGRRLRRFTLPTPVLRPAGAIGDALSRVVPLPSWLGTEALDYVLRAVEVDDTATERDLGIAFRDPQESIDATIRSLVAAGALDARHAGTLG
jgi:UDP-glucose 4-epimerase